MRYISHLDLMRLFQRALRRAEFDIYLTKGFNPHPIVRIKKAVKLGLDAYDLEAEVVLNKDMDLEVFKNNLQAELPPDINIKKTEVLK